LPFFVNRLGKGCARHQKAGRDSDDAWEFSLHRELSQQIASIISHLTPAPARGMSHFDPS
jgi:hypothetical protein